MRRTALLVTAMSAVLAAVAPSPASSAGLEVGERTRVTVVSVDGPRDFTVRLRHHVYRVRIDNIDAPLGAFAGRRAECGATLAIGQLRRLARVGHQLFVFAYGLRDNGRELVDAEHEVGHDNSDLWFSDTLIGRGVARPGIGQPITAHVIPSTDLVDLEFVLFPGESVYIRHPVSLARRQVGVWGACNGRFHLPAGKTPPPVRSAMWEITPEGRATAVGPLKLLPTDAQPGAVTTFGDAARAFPDLEIVRSYTGLCVGTSGRSGLRFQSADSNQGVGSKHRRSCAQTAIRSITSTAGNRATLGPGVGTAAADLAASFPKVTVDGDYAELDGLDLITPRDNVDHSPPTAWRTAATLAEGRLTGYFTRLPFPS